MHPYIISAIERSKMKGPLSKQLLFSEDIERMGLKSEKRIDGILETDLIIRYTRHPLVPAMSSECKRAFVRYDFSQEWNNQGYGRITTLLGTPFSCCLVYTLPEPWQVLAEVINIRTGEKISDYAAIKTDANGVNLWFNRQVGPIDGHDWSIVENFLSRYQVDKWGGSPVVNEVPYGYEGAITMRIDCDEAVASGRRLFELYKKYEMPFSMAIKTKQPLREAEKDLMRDVISCGGSVVGHSHTHAPNWGGDAASAQWEVEESHRVLRSLGIEGINYDYVVSPFHQNSREAVEGLRNAGVKAFVSGIICNDPEFLMARAGQVPLVDGILSHSQQCMFHGDTYHQDGNTIDGYKLAWQQALETKTFFGYLDHPFSNYWYGWASEEERLSVHEEFLVHLGTYSNIWRASLVDALRFIEMKSTVKVEQTSEGFKYTLPFNDKFRGLPSIEVVYGEKSHELRLGEEIVIIS